jgi:hypothetical protein
MNRRQPALDDDAGLMNADEDFPGPGIYFNAAEGLSYSGEA